MGTQTLITAAQFAQLPPEETEDRELVDGELVALSSANFDHSLIKDFVVTSLRIYLRTNPVAAIGSEIDCELSDAVIRRPDIALFLNATGRTVPRKQVPIPFAPDIAIEVLSPSEAAVDINRKVREYETAGCKEVWVIDKENGEVFLYTADGDRRLRTGAKLTSLLLPGFELPVAEILNQ